MKVKKFYEQLYKAPIYYIFNCDQKTAQALFEKEGIKVNHYEWGVAHTFAWHNEGNIVYGIWVGDIKHLETFAHEIVHLAGFIFQDRHIRYDPENDESFAYLVEYLFKALLKGGEKNGRTRSKTTVKRIG